MKLALPEAVLKRREMKGTVGRKAAGEADKELAAAEKRLDLAVDRSGLRVRTWEESLLHMIFFKELGFRFDLRCGRDQYFLYYYCSLFPVVDALFFRSILGVECKGGTGPKPMG